MINVIIQYISDLRTSTEVLEELNWDEELTQEFSDELTIRLNSAPPNVDKALFWLRHTPWDCFGGEGMPENLYTIVEKLMTGTAEKINSEMGYLRHQKFLNQANRGDPDTDEEWN